MGLQTAFYIIGIIFMTVMLLLTIGILVALWVIKSKINRMHQAIDQKLATAQDAIHKGTAIFRILRIIFSRKA
jgi:hypothetical protein